MLHFGQGKVMEYHSHDLEVTQEAVALYAEVTDDFNPIHLDSDFAMKTAMGGVIAHGTLSLGLVWDVLSRVPGFDGAHAALDIRFVRPVRLGNTVRAGARATESGGLEVWVENERGELVIAGSATVRPGEQQ